MRVGTGGCSGKVHAARLLRAGRELAALGGVGIQKAEIDAAQMVQLR